MKDKRMYKIIPIMLIIIIFFPYTVVFGASVTAVGNAIASFAVNYYNQTQTGKAPYTFHPFNLAVEISDDVYFTNRGLDKETGKPVLNPYSYDPNGNFEHYGIDCVGWVSFCVYNATGLEYNPVLTGYGGYVCPDGSSDTEHFEDLGAVTAQAGDILYNPDIGGWGHVMVCTGPGEAIESTTLSGGGDYKGPFKTTSISGYSVARIKESAANAIDESTLKSSMAPASTLFGKDQSEFYYNGIPDGKYSVTSGNILEWIVNTLKEIFSFVANLITYVIRMVFVGWTFLIENMLTDIIQKISGEESVIKINATDYGKEGNKYTDDNVTIEKIIFDNIKIFDVDFFNVGE